MSSARRSLSFLRAGNALRGLFIATLVLFVAAAINYMFQGPGRGTLLGAGIVFPFLVMFLAAAVNRDRIDSRLGDILGTSLYEFKVVTQDFPEYRFVDVFRATEKLLSEGATTTLDSLHSEELGVIISGFFAPGYGFPQEPPRAAYAVDSSKREYFPTHRFWIRKPKPGGRVIIARLRHVEYPNVVRLEVASRDPAYAAQIMAEIRALSESDSIYRGAAIEASIAVGVRDEYGNIDQQGQIKVEFRKAPAVTDTQIVLDPRVWPLIEHSLVNFHQNYQLLRACGVVLKRGFLFHGPPGTGKSFTCRYLTSLLQGTTAIYCTGTALHNVESAFNLARMLKPAVIVMEDVDLAFASRDINQHSSVLGDLFDAIDALADDDPISMILTTNAIDRVEAAVKDRPGRVSQCVYFGPPSPELRQRYILSYLKVHDVAALDVHRVVKETEGASQAFLKELVHRALQFAIEAGRHHESQVRITNADFSAALDEMRAFDGKSARAITGFRVDAN